MSEPFAERRLDKAIQLTGRPVLKGDRQNVTEQAPCQEALLRQCSFTQAKPQPDMEPMYKSASKRKTNKQPTLGHLTPRKTILD